MASATPNPPNQSPPEFLECQGDEDLSVYAGAPMPDPWTDPAQTDWPDAPEFTPGTEDKF